MRIQLNNYLNNNAKILQNKIRFLHNDLWSFDSKDQSFCVDLKNCENMIWGFAYGIYKQGLLPVVYGVSFFEIGRLEQLRKFFGYNKAKILIFNAGAVGYDIYGWEHAFKNEDDIKIMQTLGFDIIKSEFTTIERIFNIYFNSKRNIYVRLGSDDLKEIKCMN
jgi:transketolase C-terminal domain/subunit